MYIPENDPWRDGWEKPFAAERSGTAPCRDAHEAERDDDDPPRRPIGFRLERTPDLTVMLYADYV